MTDFYCVNARVMDCYRSRDDRSSVWVLYVNRTRAIHKVLCGDPDIPPSARSYSGLITLEAYSPNKSIPYCVAVHLSPPPLSFFEPGPPPPVRPAPPITPVNGQ